MKGKFVSVNISGSDQPIVFVTDTVPGSENVGDRSGQTREFSIEYSPGQRVRSLIEIYESCRFALSVTDLGTYEEAAKLLHWEKAMELKMNSI